MLVETKCDVGDKIYFVFGNPKKNIIVFSATITKISIFTGNNIMYSFGDAKVEVDKEGLMKNKDYIKFGFFYEKDLDKGNSLSNSLGLSNWPVFTTKEKCKEYLRRVTK